MKFQSSFQDFLCARNDIALDVGHAVVVGSPILNGHHHQVKWHLHYLKQVNHSRTLITLKIFLHFNKDNTVEAT